MLLALVVQLSCAQVVGDLLDDSARQDPASGAGASANSSSARLLPSAGLQFAGDSEITPVLPRYRPAWPMVLAAGAVLSTGTSIAGLTLATGWAGWGWSQAAISVFVGTVVVTGACLLVITVIAIVNAVLQGQSNRRVAEQRQLQEQRLRAAVQDALDRDEAARPRATPPPGRDYVCTQRDIDSMRKSGVSESAIHRACGE